MFGAAGLGAREMTLQESRARNLAQHIVLSRGGTREEAIAAGDKEILTMRRREASENAAEGAKRSAQAQAEWRRQQSEEYVGTSLEAGDDGGYDHGDSNMKWWLLGGAAVLLVGGGIFWMRRQK